jgi:hypothetical protein
MPYENGSGWGAERKKIELNILENIPSEELLLYMHCWEFEETKIKHQERLKESTTTLYCH